MLSSPFVVDAGISVIGVCVGLSGCCCCRRCVAVAAVTAAWLRFCLWRQPVGCGRAVAGAPSHHTLSGQLPVFTCAILPPPFIVCQQYISRPLVCCCPRSCWFRLVRKSAEPAQSGGKGGATAPAVYATAEPVGEVQYGHPTAGYASAAPVNVATPLNPNG